MNHGTIFEQGPGFDILVQHVAGTVFFQIIFGVEKMEIWTEMRQCLLHWRRKFSVGSPLVIKGFRALSHTCFQTVCIFYGALGLGVSGCICACSAPQENTQKWATHGKAQHFPEGIELTKSSPNLWHMGSTLAIVVWWPRFWCLHHW